MKRTTFFPTPLFSTSSFSASFFTAVVTLLLVGFVVSCSQRIAEFSAEQQQATEALNNQKIVFEAEYINYAWGYQHKGIFVDHQGNVYEYDRKGVRWVKSDNDGPLREQDLLGKYTNTKLLKTLDAAIMRDKFALALNIKSELSDVKARCADAGTWTLWAYRKNNDVYGQTLLFRAGDVAQENRSTEARALAAWIRSLDSRLEQMPCEP